MSEDINPNTSDDTAPSPADTEAEAGKGGEPLIDGGGSPAGGGDTARADGESATGGEGPKPWFPDNWREAIANSADEDQREKYAEFVKRFSSPTEIAQAYMADKERMKGMVAIPNEKSDEKEWAAFRQAMDIPQEPSQYEYEQPEGVPELDEFDKYHDELFREAAFKANFTKAHYALARRFLDTYIQAGEAKAQEEAAKFAREQDDERRIKYGRDYRAVVETTNRFLDEIMPNGRELLETPMANGGKLGDDNRFFDLLVKMSREYYGPGAMINGEPADNVDIDKRIDEIEAMITGDPDQYAKPEIQQEYRELLAAKKRREAAAR